MALRQGLFAAGALLALDVGACGALVFALPERTVNRAPMTLRAKIDRTVQHASSVLYYQVMLGLPPACALLYAFRAPR